MRDENSVGGVVRGKLILKIVAPGAWDVVEAVEGDVPKPALCVAEAFREAESIEHVEPLSVAGRLVVADDGEEGDRGVPKTGERLDSLNEVRKVRPAVVIEVAGVDDGVHVRLDGIVDHPFERPHKVIPSGRRVVLPVAEVSVRGVEETRHARLFRRRRQRRFVTGVEVKVGGRPPCGAGFAHPKPLQQRPPTGVNDRYGRRR